MPIDWRGMEAKWQEKWRVERVSESDPDPSKPKFFLTVAYPYPNSPQHVGHARTYTLTDVYARYKRMRGFNVLLPMGFHYTGTPILAMSKRVRAGDADLVDEFVNVYKVPRDVVSTFTEPIRIARYFHDELKRGMIEIGYSIDWRREFTTMDPPYNRFIEWQFERLREKGLITRGSHPVGWCPSCGNPVGQHDTKGDVEPEIGEFTLLKFELEPGRYLPAGTLRPETVFGVTNMWVRPDAEYAVARVDGEEWIVSRQCTEKVRLLGRKVEVEGSIEGRNLVGRFVRNLVTGDRVIILPASFVDLGNATGVVTSVPAHAPYDYVALRELASNADELLKYGLTPESVSSIKPIPLISVAEYTGIPAEDVVKRMGIRKQDDRRLEEATKEVYAREFHTGVMKENTGKYAGMRVSEAKDKLTRDLIAEGKAEGFFEILNRPVVCRCGAECVVKIFEDQWFINYGDPAWKALAHECLNAMSVLPDEIREEFDHVVDWLREKACARKAGLGTILPWDKAWIIESLSDSVIYMAYYIVSRYVNQFGVKASHLTDEVLDYVLLGVGSAGDVGRKAGLDEALLRRMREEFSYFYPLDSRHSGRDLVPNHLTYFIFNHVAIFPRELWPRQIVVNGSVLMEGKKMSKSMGNIIPLRDAIRMYGADPVRFAVLAQAELLQDTDFSPTLAKSTGDRLERFLAQVRSITATESEAPSERKQMDRWMISRLQRIIAATTESMESLRVREAVYNAFYLLSQDVQWYMRRSRTSSSEGGMKRTLDEVLDAWVRLLVPFIPHVAEEAWSAMGRAELVSAASWPEPDTGKIDETAESDEEYFKAVFEDTQRIQQVTGMRPKRIVYYTAPAWKWKAYLKILEMSEKGRLDVGTVMRELMSDPALRRFGGAVQKFVQKAVQDATQAASEIRRNRTSRGVVDDHALLREASPFISREFEATVEVCAADAADRYDPKGRSEMAEPYRPAIYME